MEARRHLAVEPVRSAAYQPPAAVPSGVRRLTSPTLGQDHFIGSGAPAPAAARQVSTLGSQIAAAVQGLFHFIGSLFVRVRETWRSASTPPVAGPVAPTPIVSAPTPVAIAPTPIVAPPSPPPAPPAPPPPPIAAPPAPPAPPAPTPPAPTPAPVTPPVAVAPTPAPEVSAPAAPGGAKPPIRQQYIRPGDQTAATYGASGSAWVFNGDGDEPQYVSQAIREAKAQNQTPVFTQYFAPNRDKGGGSAGGAANSEAYAASVERNAKLIGDAPAVVVIEPDALAFGLDPADIKRAVEIYKRHCPNARLYIDAGNALWPSDVGEMADALIKAGVADADGFALNVSNFIWTTDSMKRGNDLLAALKARDPKLANKQYVVDTSRNGNGPGVDETGKDTWGDPVRAKNGGPIMNGPLPTTETGDPNCAAFLWIKPPGWGDFRNRNANQFGGQDWVTPNAKPPLGPVTGN